MSVDECIALYVYDYMILYVIPITKNNITGTILGNFLINCKY